MDSRLDGLACDGSAAACPGPLTASPLTLVRLRALDVWYEPAGDGTSKHESFRLLLQLVAASARSPEGSEWRVCFSDSNLRAVILTVRLSNELHRQGLATKYHANSVVWYEIGVGTTPSGSGA